ncbi:MULTISPECIES: DNA-processing protein DprA [Kordiimonas]|jgi:DNA processing protein|uniref:DNA-processing protein DprA n=1 Tax=Kordiimonas TaxID=288021 RepID=UPI00257E0707|nr:DNA-processing protein DprA [Kordiimonas sp. UBA4487]
MNKTETDQSLSDAEKLAQLRLIRTEGIGPVTFRGLLARFGNAVQALEGALDLAARRGRKKPLKPPSQSAAEQELERITEVGGHALFLNGADYPPQLAAIEDAPPVLFTIGRLDLLHGRSVGIVGARNASVSGLKLTRTIASALADAGVTITSGLARGIDTAAHQASVDHGTIACVAGGLDIFYPPENEALQRQIAEVGLLVSEMPMGTRPQARHFPRRNRLISGLSQGILVVEAAIKSGSLITARFAAEQGREVFAIPGSPLDPRAKGGNHLIKDGAVLVEGADDILAEMQTLPDPGQKGHTPRIRRAQNSAPVAQKGTPIGPISPAPAPKAPTGTSDLLGLLTSTPIHMDDVVRQSGASTEEVLAAFLELELAGEITRHSGGRVSRNYA